MSLSPTEKISFGDGTIGFVLPPEGDFLMELTGKYETPQKKDKDDSVQKNAKLIEIVYAGKSEYTLNVYIDMDEERGLKRLMDILYYSGYCDKMHAQNPNVYPSPKSGWPVSLMTHQNFARDIMVHAKGMRLMGKVVHTTDKNDKTRSFANLTKVWSVTGADIANMQTQASGIHTAPSTTPQSPISHQSAPVQEGW